MSREDWLQACEDAYPNVYRSLIAMGAAPVLEDGAEAQPTERELGREVAMRDRGRLQ